MWFFLFFPFFSFFISFLFSFSFFRILKRSFFFFLYFLFIFFFLFSHFLFFPFIYIFLFSFFMFIYTFFVVCFFFWNLWGEIVCVRLVGFRWKNKCALGGLGKGSKKITTNITKKVGGVQTTRSNKINPIFLSPFSFGVLITCVYMCFVLVFFVLWPSACVQGANVTLRKVETIPSSIHHGSNWINFWWGGGGRTNSYCNKWNSFWNGRWWSGRNCFNQRINSCCNKWIKSSYNIRTSGGNATCCSLCPSSKWSIKYCT